MVVTPMWKLKIALALGHTELWLRDFFSSHKVRADRYRRSVAELAFDTWMHNGSDFAEVIRKRIMSAEDRGDHRAVRFLQDVLMSAHDFDCRPENHRFPSSGTAHEEGPVIA
jgi:hypothetical protein